MLILINFIKVHTSNSNNCACELVQWSTNRKSAIRFPRILRVNTSFWLNAYSLNTFVANYANFVGIDDTSTDTIRYFALYNSKAIERWLFFLPRKLFSDHIRQNSSGIFCESQLLIHPLMTNMNPELRIGLRSRCN